MARIERGTARRPFEVVTLVASLGGLAALSEVLGTLPADFPARVVVVQHGQRGRDPTRLACLLQKVTPLPVRTAHAGLPLNSPGVTVIPTGWCGGLDHESRFTLTDAAADHGGDAVLGDIATAVGPAAIAVVLTGMLSDGAQGVRATKRAGGRVLVEDPATAAAAGMPSSTIATGCIDFVLPLARVAPALIALTMAPGGAELLTVATPSWARLPA